MMSVISFVTYVQPQFFLKMSALMTVLVRLTNFREWKKYKYQNIIWVGSEKNNIELQKWV